MVTHFGVLADVELDGFERDGIGAHIISAAQRLQVNQQGVVLARGKCRGIVLGLELEVIGRGLEAVACINLHILDQHCRVEYKGNRIRQTEQVQILGQLQIRRTVRGVLTSYLAGFLIEVDVLRTCTFNRPAFPSLVLVGVRADFHCQFAGTAVSAHVIGIESCTVMLATHHAIVDDDVARCVDATISALLGNADGYESSLVKINKVNFEANALTSRSVTVMDEEGDELNLYDKFNVLSSASFNTSDQFNIIGFLARNGENVEFGVTAIEAVPKNVAAPTFNIETGTYEVDQTVTLTAEEGTTIYYTIDGTTPTAKSTVYTTPIIVQETTTINAIAVDAKGSTSTIASVTITIDKPYTTIAELNTACTATKKADAPTVKFKFTDLLVTGVKNSNVYVSDGEKGFLIYGNGYSFKKGDKISGTITGLLYSYSGLNELAVSDNYANVTIASSGNAVTTTEKTIQTINADYKALESQYVTILNVTFGATAVSSKNVSISDGTGSLTLRDNFNILSSETFDTSATYTVKAFVLNYNGTAQVYPIAVEDIVKNVPDAINGVKVATEEGSIYTLQGQKVERITNKGIYIINGKKVLVK